MRAPTLRAAYRAYAFAFFAAFFACAQCGVGFGYARAGPAGGLPRIRLRILICIAERIVTFGDYLHDYRGAELRPRRFGVF